MRFGTLAVVLFVVLLLVVCAESKRSKGSSKGRHSHGHQTASHRRDDKHANHRCKHDSSSEEDTRHAGKRTHKGNVKKHSTEQFLKHEKQVGGDGKSKKTKHSGRHGSSLLEPSRNKTKLDGGKYSHSSLHVKKHNTSLNSSRGIGTGQENHPDVKRNSTHNYGWNMGKLQNSSHGLDSFHGTKQQIKHNSTNSYGGADGHPAPPYGWNVPNYTNPNLGSGSQNHGGNYSRQFLSFPIAHSFDSQSGRQKTHLGTNQRQTYTNIGWNVHGRAADGPIHAPMNRAAAVSSYFDLPPQVGFIPNPHNAQTQSQHYDNYGQSSNYLVKLKDKKKKKKKNKFDISLEDFSFEDLTIDKSDLKDLLTGTVKELSDKLKSHSSKLPARRIYSTKFPKYNRRFDLKPFSFNGSLQNFTNLSKNTYIDRPSVPKFFAGLETTNSSALIRDKRNLSEDEQRLIKIINDFMAKEKAWNEARIRERRDVEGIIVAKDKINDESHVGKDVNVVDNFKFGQVEALVDDRFDISVFAKLPKEITKATAEGYESEEDNTSDKSNKRNDGAAISNSDKQSTMALDSSRKITKLFRVHETIDQFLKRRPLSIQTKLNQAARTLDNQKESKVTDGEEKTPKSTDPDRSLGLYATTITATDRNSGSIISNKAEHTISSANSSHENISHSLNSIILPPRSESGGQVKGGFEITISQLYNRTGRINTSNIETTPVVSSSGSIERKSTEEFSEEEADTRGGITVTEGLTTGVGLTTAQVDDEGVKEPKEATSNVFARTRSILTNPIEHMVPAGVLYSVSTEKTSEEVIYAKATSSEETTDYREAESSRNGSPEDRKARMTGFSIISIHRKSNYYLPPKRLRKMKAKGRVLVGEVLIAAPRKSVKCPRGSRLLRGRCRAVWGRY